MKNAVYFFGRGVALHYWKSVPSYPASHGCVRIKTLRNSERVRDNVRPGITKITVSGKWDGSRCYQQRKKNKKKYDLVRRLKQITKVSKTKKTGSTSKTRYGFSFYHFFKPKPKSCNASGVQLSKSVKIKRDDLGSGASSRSRGGTVWSLTGKKRLNSSDSVRLGGGSKGLGSAELKKWPAVLESKHTWYYRLSKFRPWVSGPSINIKMILNGDRKDKKKLSVKTVVNGVSLSQKYTGPMPIRIKKPKVKQKPWPD